LNGLRKILHCPDLTFFVYQCDANDIHLRVKDVCAVHRGVHPLPLNICSIRTQRDVLGDSTEVSICLSCARRHIRLVRKLMLQLIMLYHPFVMKLGSLRQFRTPAQRPESLRRAVLIGQHQ
jgi:hypothetical protein